MSEPTALVTGAAGFVGRHMVRKLWEVNHRVKAGIHCADDWNIFEGLDGVEPVHMDILDHNSLSRAMEGVDAVYHFAALVDSRKTREELCLVNSEGTRNVWESAAAAGVAKALYCSSTAVYGLLAGSSQPITEDVPARAIEPYGYSKRLGEVAVVDSARRTGMHTTIIRPVAVFGPGEHTSFGEQLRDAVVSRLLVAGGFQNKQFNYVHAEDVANAALFLMQNELPSGDIYNISVPTPMPFKQAFQAYIRMFRRAGNAYTNVRILAILSYLLNALPRTVQWISKMGGGRFLFFVWHPGFDMCYSAEKLLSKSFAFTWIDFDEVLYSCIGKELNWSQRIRDS